MVQFFNEEKKCVDLEVYKQWFEETSSDWENVSKKQPQNLFEFYLISYHNCFKEAALLRAELIPWLYTKFGHTEKTNFTVPLCEFLSKNSMEGQFEDTPHMKGSLAKMMGCAIVDLGFAIEDFKMIFHWELDYAEGQKYDYENVFEELEKYLDTRGETAHKELVVTARKNMSPTATT